MPIEYARAAGARERAPLRRFVAVCRQFGLVVAVRVAYSKLRGALHPALALPEPPVYAGHREVSILLSTADHDAAALSAVIETLSRRGMADWEVCICERRPVTTEMARALALVRGTRPWIRIVTAGESVASATASRWTVEQATGRFVALLAPGCAASAAALALLLDRMRREPAVDAAVLVGPPGKRGLAGHPRTDCRLAVQRKRDYLAASCGCWPLTAGALAARLDGGGVSTAWITATSAEVAV